jgi:hypothetical protein
MIMLLDLDGNGRYAQARNTTMIISSIAVIGSESKYMQKWGR